MTVAEFLGSYAETINRRISRRTEEISAVYDDELWEILEDLDLLEALDAGHLSCPVTGELLYRENVGGIVVTSAGPRVVAEMAVGKVEPNPHPAWPVDPARGPALG